MLPIKQPIQPEEILAAYRELKIEPLRKDY